MEIFTHILFITVLAREPANTNPAVSYEAPTYIGVGKSVVSAKKKLLDIALSLRGAVSGTLMKRWLTCLYQGRKGQKDHVFNNCTQYNGT